jgi:capsular exopolysaccharide synthesis family protein
MTSQPTDYTLRTYFEVLARQKLVIVLVAIICAVLAFGISAVEKKKYQATATVVVSDPSQGLALLGTSYLSTSSPLQLASAAAPQVTRNEVVTAVKRSLHSSLSTAALSNLVTTAINPNSYLLEITTTAANAQRAARLANAFAFTDSRITTAETRTSYRNQATALERGLGRNADSTAAVTVIENAVRLKNLASVATPLAVSTAASVPSSPASPRPVRNTLAGLAFGLFLGIAIAVARSALDRRLRHPDDVTQALPHPVVGHIGSGAFVRDSRLRRGKRLKRSPLVEADAEAFRILRQNLQSTPNQDVGTILVTSAMAQEGKSTVAMGLATAFADAGRRTLLVECDLRRPVLADRLGLAAVPGLTDFLTGSAQPQEIIRPITPEMLGRDTRDARRQNKPGTFVCITAGAQVPRPTDLLNDGRFHTFLAEVGAAYEVVVVDSAPILPVGDTLAIVPDASTVLLCVRLRQTTRDQAQSAQETLERLQAEPVSLVLTDVTATGDGYYGGYYDATPSAPAPTAA